MSIASTGDERRLQAAAKKAGRALEAAQAMRDYKSEKLRVEVNTARLRALRLAKEAADALVPTEQPAVKRKTAGCKPAATRVNTRAAVSA